jgi:hypothetical protein
MNKLRAIDIANMLAEMLMGAAGGKKQFWLEQIGPVEFLPVAKNVKSNWRAAPIATGDNLAAISKAIELLRAEHPYVIG